MNRFRNNNIYLIFALIFVLVLTSCSKTFESTISTDNLSATDDKVTIVFSELDLSNETTVSMEEVSISNVKDLEATVLTYDFTVDETTDFVGTIDIEMPYDIAIIDEGESPLQCVEVAYLNETTNKWEAVQYSINPDSGTVTIFAKHLSTYGVFTFKNPQTRLSSAFYDEYKIGYPMIDMDSSEYAKVVQEYIDNDGSTGGYAFDLGVSLLNDTVGLGGNTLTLLTETLGSSGHMTTVTSAFEKVGIAAALYQVVVDYQSGDNVAMTGNATKNISYYVISKLGSSAAKVASVGVFAIDYSINKFATTAWAGRTKIYTKAYEMYYGEKSNEARKRKYSIERQFYDKFYKAYEDNLAEGGTSEDLNKKIESILNAYVYDFWQDEVNIGIYYQKASDDKVGSGTLGSGGGLNDKLMKDISENAKKELVRTSLAPVFRTLSKNITLNLHAEYVSEMQNLETILNEITEINMYEENSTGKADDLKFANGTYRFSPLESSVKPEDWTGKLNNKAEGTTTFTLLGHMQSGLPNTIDLYLADLNPDTDEPTKSVSIPFGSNKISINIGLMSPTLDDLIGEWTDLENNSLTVKALNIPWDEIQAMIDEAKAEEEEGKDSECDFLEIDLTEAREKLGELVGVVEAMVFNIEKTSDTQAVLHMTSFPEDEEGTCEQATQMPFPFTYADGNLDFDVALLNQHIASQNNENAEDNDIRISSIDSDVTATILSESKTKKVIGIDGEFELFFSAGDEEQSLNFSIRLGITGQQEIDLTMN